MTTVLPPPAGPDAGPDGGPDRGPGAGRGPDIVAADPSRPAADLLLGARLAASAGRLGWARLLLAVVAVGAGVMVLLFAASVPGGYRSAQARADGLISGSGEPLPGVDPVYVRYASDEFRGKPIAVIYVRAGGPHAPVPPGLDRLPAPGEAAVSPALRRMMAAPDGELLRDRYPRAAAVIGHAGLTGPAQLSIYVGDARVDGEHLTSWGLSQPRDPMPPLLWALLVVGVVVLLFPVFVFVASSARLADAERDRRLGALRLIGASAAQLRRVAVGESLLAALLGLIAGAGAFLAARPLVDGQSFVYVSVFASDLVPSWPLVVLIVIAVPVLTAGSTLFTLRHTLVEPLGVVRQAAPSRRRLWWRLLPSAAGGALLLYLTEAGGAGHNGGRPVVALSAGVVLLLLGIPTVLPWMLQRVLRRPRDETLALQLATRRLAADSGTPARVVGGIGVVLAGAIGLSSLLTAAEDRFGGPAEIGLAPGQATVSLDPATGGSAGQLGATLRQLPAVTVAGQLRLLDVRSSEGQVGLVVGTCADLRRLVALPPCVDGRAFLVAGSVLTAGEKVSLVVDEQGNESAVPWTIPAGTPAVANTTAGPQVGYRGLLATPGAVPQAMDRLGRAVLDLRYDPADGDAIERIRTAVAPLAWHAEVRGPQPLGAGSSDDHTYQTIRRGLLAGALLTLVLAGATLLAAAVDQVRQRRWPLAALAATGVPRSILARSVLWQTAIPMLFAVLVADVTGVVLGALLPLVVSAPVRIDWIGVGLYSAAALAVVGAVALLTLPAVRQATRPTSLRTE